jgi:ketosteroid isomerase-like protein
MLRLLLFIAPLLSVSPQNGWQNRYDFMARAMTKNNLAAYKSLLLPSYEMVDTEQMTTNYEEALEVMRERPKLKFEGVNRIWVKRVIENGDLAFVSYKWAWDSRYTSGGVRRRWRGVETGTDYWQKIKGKWRLYFTDVNRMRERVMGVR